MFSFCFSDPPFLWRVSYIIYPLLGHLGPTLVDHLSLHLSACPIKHPLWLFMSCGSQYNTVQGSSQLKCIQESSCSAFNAVVAAFSNIILRSHHFWTFMIHIFITGASWKVIVIVRTRIWDVFINVRWDIPPQTILPSIFRSLSPRLEPFITIHSSSDCLVLS